MTPDEEERALRDPDSWDWESGETLAKPDDPGAVVAVRFTVAEITQLSDAARRVGKPLTQYIHDSSLAHLPQPQAAER